MPYTQLGIHLQDDRDKDLNISHITETESELPRQNRGTLVNLPRQNFGFCRTLNGSNPPPNLDVMGSNPFRSPSNSLRCQLLAVIFKSSGGRKKRAHNLPVNWGVWDISLTKWNDMQKSNGALTAIQSSPLQR